MLQTDLGFDADRLLRARIVLRASDYPDPSGFFRFPIVPSLDPDR